MFPTELPYGSCWLVQICFASVVSGQVVRARTIQNSKCLEKIEKIQWITCTVLYTLGNFHFIWTYGLDINSISRFWLKMFTIFCTLDQLWMAHRGAKSRLDFVAQSHWSCVRSIDRRIYFPCSVAPAPIVLAWHASIGPHTVLADGLDLLVWCLAFSAIDRNCSRSHTVTVDVSN